MATESAWLIEAAGPKWWDGSGFTTAAFVTDANKAMRFSRKADAQKAIIWLLPLFSQLLKATEHGWMDSQEEEEGQMSSVRG